MHLQELVDACSLDILCSGFEFQPRLPGVAWNESRGIFKTGGPAGLNFSLAEPVPYAAVYLPREGPELMQSSSQHHSDGFPDGALGMCMSILCPLKSAKATQLGVLISFCVLFPSVVSRHAYTRPLQISAGFGTLMLVNAIQLPTH